MSTDEDWLLVDNVSKGFDLYQYPQNSPSESFLVPRKTAYIHEAAFLEGGRFVVCGSNHGIIYIFCPESGKCIQKLSHGSRRSLIQVLDVCSFA
jgi:hypothetical protein